MNKRRDGWREKKKGISMYDGEKVGAGPYIYTKRLKGGLVPLEETKS